jgi:NAD(P)-dependent dehydrogenase (short-subunit alcohol dehydrogenase family)
MLNNVSPAMPTVFIVSTDSPVGQSASQHLAAKGYDVVAATDATEGLRVVDGLDIDAVFDTGVRICRLPTLPAGCAASRPIGAFGCCSWSSLPSAGSPIQSP